ncbi:MAG: hypothetical protein LBB89_12820 [Treponema sp.]|jgi:hypothetical protein|nr:hypothetical protein [Treponema sp.]
MILEADGQKALGFDTGLDSRAFAQAKLARLITEPGLIVRPAPEGPHRIELWKASGVIERSDSSGKPTMVVWGPLFEGDRLDLLLNESAEPDTVLAAICAWIQSILALGENPPAAVSPWPCAAIIAQESGNGGALPSPAVFFAPPSLAQRCIIAAAERYVHPDLDGMNGAAFTAAAMLYRIFAGTPPFSAADESTLHQDMREGNFLPVRFAVPGLDARPSALIQQALEPPYGKGAQLLGEILAVVQPDGKTVSAASLVQPLSETDRLPLEKEKIQFQKRKTASVKTRRFVMRNATILLGCCAALVTVVLVAVSIIHDRSRLPSTAGMEPAQVIESYYNAFGELDHQMMEACVINGAGKGDINSVITLFVVNKTRQVYEKRNSSFIISAREWQQEGGGAIDTQVFGVTGLHITINKEQAEEVQYRADYTLWVPAQLSGDTEMESTETNLPIPYHRTDIITLVRKKEKRGFNWHIAEIQRE